MSLQEYIGIEQAKALSRHGKIILISTFPVGAVMVGVLGQHFPTNTLMLWFTFFVSLAVCRWWSTRNFRPDTTTVANYQKRLNVFTLWGVINGLNWGTLPFIFHDSNAPIYSVYLACILSGYISAAASQTSYHLLTFLGFSISAMLLFILRFITEGGSIYYGLALNAVIFLSFMIAFARVAQRNYKFTKSLEYENQFLLNEVTEEKNRAENAVREKSRFLAATSHDLRQPLHAMNLYIDALNACLSTQKQTDILEKIALSGNALNDLLHELLDISRLDANVVENRPQHLAITTIAKHLKEEFSPQALESNLHLIVDVDEKHIAYADPILLERVIRNLISNAIKYTHQGHIRVSSKMLESVVEISVCDTGIGVAQDKISSIFSEFTQIGNPERDRNKGLGLGLSIVKRLCDLQGIKLTFESRLNQGTQVRLQLTRGNAGLLPIEIESAESSFERLTILCIDDEESIRDGMELIIRSWQCHPIIATNGRGAIAAVQQLDAPLDLIISDLRLRDEESGIKIIQAIREELNEDIPAVVVTGDTAIDRIKLVKDFNVVMMHKPIKPEHLREKIECLME